MKDVYGKALLDYMTHPGNQQIEVLSDIAEDDAYPVSWFFRAPNDFPIIEQKALDLCRGKILDIGAGTGIHALALQHQGMDVTAIDVSEGAVKIMQHQGVKQAMVANFYDLKNTTYDTLLMLMNGFGIMGKLDRVDHFFEKALTLLSPNGQIIADSSDLIALYQEEDGSVLLDLNGPYYGEIEYTMKYNGEKGAPFPWLFIDFDTLAYHAEKNGLKAVKIFEDSSQHYLAQITRK